MVSGSEKIYKRAFPVKGWYFLVTAVFAAFTASVILADSFRAYESEVSVLVIAKSEVSAGSLGKIVANMERIAGTDQFRSAFFSALSERSGLFDAFSASMRNDIMDEIAAIRTEKGSSVISIRAMASDADDAKIIARQAALTLFGSVGQYYNLKEDIDLRVISGPTVSARITNPVLFAFASIALGLATTSVFFLVLFGIPDVISFFERKRRFSRNTLDAKVFEPEMPTSPFLRDTIETDREEAAAVIAEHDIVSVPEHLVPIETVVPVLSAHEKKGSAPSNLPSLSEAEAQFLREFSFEGSLENEEATEVKEALVSEGTLSIRAEAAPKEEVGPDADHEPTEAEYKRRLNELLRG
jgi:hypothetical protein